MSWRATLPLIAGWMTSSVVEAGIVNRAQQSDLRLSDGRSVPRVVQDQQGNVQCLNLSGMSLEADDFDEIAKLDSLRSLVLFKTNVTDEDLLKLVKCKQLKHLNLTSTQVTDDAIGALLKFETLSTLCLGDSRISAQAVERLEESYKKKSKRGLSLGYFKHQVD